MIKRARRNIRNERWRAVQPFALVVFAKFVEVLATWIVQLLGIPS